MMNEMDKDFAVIHSQQLPNKLYVAGGGDYNKIWIRDNVYVALAFTEVGRYKEAAEIYVGLYTIIKKYEYILDGDIYPTHESQLLHPRFSTTGEVIAGPWSNKQHDSVGVLLYGVGRLYAIDKKYVPAWMQEISQKLIHYLEICRYWEDKDDGIWEQHSLLRSSSLAACIRGLEMVEGFCTYDKRHHETAKSNLAHLLPRENAEHSEDMALLSLIWPYGYKMKGLVEGVESTLLRSHGVIRFIGDSYEAISDDEPQWVMGIPWLGIAHYELGEVKKAKEYLKLTERLYTENGLPESYGANNVACVHTPLAWSHAMAIVLRSKLSA